MKTILYTFVFLLLTLSNAFSQTSVPGGIVNGKWTLAGSPYNVKGSIQILNGDSLVIESGVTVSFQGTYKFLVLGKLIAIGTPKDTIVFTAANTTDGWRGIRFDETPSTNDTSRIKYCKIQYGNATGSLTPEQNGGGLYFNNFSKAVVSYSCIINCRARNDGGGIYLGGSSPLITHNYIEGNSCKYNGAGIYISANLVLSSNIITKNNSESDGGGIYLSSGTSLISNNTITYNTAIFGAGINIQYGNSKIISNIISGNVGNYGGGIYLDGNVDKYPEISKNVISYNKANNGGGGINSTGRSIINKNFIYSNIAGAYGGGIVCRADKTIVSNNVINNNTAYYLSTYFWGGGGIFCGSHSKDLEIFNNLIVNNGSGNGGGILCHSSSPKFTNNTIANNDASENGGALYCVESSPVFINCIFWGNFAGKVGLQTFIYDEVSDPVFYNSNIQSGSNGFELNGNFYTGIYSNNIDKDPLFVNPSSGTGIQFSGASADWTLQNNSPCRDAGKSDETYTLTDLAGKKRVYNHVIDMGAYEFPVPVTDAGITLVSPLNSTYCDKIKLPVSVRLFNDGDDTLKKVNITWKLDGTVKKTVSWTGSLIPSKDSIFTIDSFLFYSSKNYGVGVYSSNPNSVADIFNTNDTAKSLVSVSPLPDASFTYKIAKDTVLFTPADTSGNTKHYWTFGDGKTATSKNPSHIYSHPGIKTITHIITSSKGCAATYTNSLNITVAGIRSYFPAEKILVYPNPFTSNTEVHYDLAKPSEVFINVYDMAGKNICSYNEGFMSSGNHSSMLDMYKLLPGIYLLKIEAGELNMYCRIIKKL